MTNYQRSAAAYDLYTCVIDRWIALSVWATGPCPVSTTISAGFNCQPGGRPVAGLLDPPTVTVSINAPVGEVTTEADGRLFFDQTAGQHCPAPTPSPSQRRLRRHRPP
ncbi:MAG: hypothetical protein R2932_52715 [Caldilineaceae bacterium]